MPDSITVDATINDKQFIAGSREMAQAVKSFNDTVKDVDRGLRSSFSSYGAAIKNAAHASRDFNSEMRGLEEKAKALESAIKGARKESLGFQILSKSIKEAENEMVRLAAKMKRYEAQGAKGADDYKRLVDERTKLNQKVSVLRGEKASMFGDRSKAAEREKIDEQLEPYLERLKEINAQLEIYEKSGGYNDAAAQYANARKELEALNAEKREMLESGSAYEGGADVTEQLQELKTLQEKIRAMKQAGLNTPELGGAIRQELEAQIGETEQLVQKLQTERDQLKAEQEKYLQEAFGGANNLESYRQDWADYEKYINDSSSKIEKTKARIEEIKEKIDEIDSGGPTGRSIMANYLGFDPSTVLEQQRESLVQELSMLESDLQDYNEYVAEWRQDLDDEFAGAMQSLEGNEAFEEKTQQIEQLNERIDEATTKLNDMNGMLDSASGESQNEEQNKQSNPVDFMSKSMDEYMGKWQKMATLSGMVGGKMAAAFTPILHPIQAVDRALGFLVQKAGQVAVSLARMAGHAALSFLRNLASTAVNAAIQLAKLAGNAVMSGLRRLATAAKNAAVSIAKLGGAAVKKALSGLALIAQKGVKGLTGLNKGARSSGQSFGTSLKNVLKYAFGIRSLFFLFRRLRNAVSEGLGEIAKKNPQLKAALDSLKKSLNGLKGSLASAFAPIITAVAPALTRLINLLTTAINTIGAFFAALTGQKVYTKSIGAVGESAEKSSGKVKELEKQLASFDDLDILKANDGSGSGSGSSGDGFSYENVPIDSAIGDFVDKLKELFAAGKYEEIGRIIADGLNKAIQKVQDWIKWDNVGAIVTKYMNALTGAINGLVDEFDWENLGATIGEGLNTITNTLLLWYRGIDWENLGKKFAEGVNGLIDRVDWDNLGRLISARIGSVISILKGAVTTIKWGDAGTKFASAVNGFFEDENLWKDAGTTIDTAIKGLLDFTGKFIVTFDAYTAGQRISEAFSQIDLDGIADRFWVNVKLAFQKAGSFIDALLGGTSGGKLVDNFKVKKSVWDDIAEKLSSGFNTAVSKFTDFISDIPITNTVSAIYDWLLKVVNGISFKGIGTALGIVIRQAMNFAGTALEKLVQNGFTLGQDIADALNAALDEIDWDSDNPGSVRMIIENGFKGAVKLVKGFFEKFDAIKFAGELRSALFGPNGVDWSGIAKDIWDTLASALSKFGDFLTVLFGGDVDDGFFRSINNMYNKIGKQNEYGKEDKESSGFGFEEKIAQAINTVGSTILTGLAKAIESVNWGAIGSSLHTILEGIDWSDLASKVWELFSEVLTSIYDLVGGLLLGDQWEQAKEAKEESRENTMAAFERTYAQDAQSALRAWGMAYGVNLEGLDHDEAKRRVQIMNNAELEGKDPVVALVKELNSEGKSLREVAAELKLTPEALKDMYKNELAADFFTGKLGQRTGEYQDAVDIANHLDALSEIVGKISSGENLTIDQIMKDYGVNFSIASLLLEEATRAVDGNTDALKDNTISVDHFDVKDSYGLNFREFEKYGDYISESIQNGLNRGNFVEQIPALLSVGVPEEAVHEAAKEFLNRWNKENPTAPITIDAGSFDELQHMFGGTEAYKLMRDAGVNMSEALAEGIWNGNVKLRQVGEDLILEFEDGTTYQLSEAEKELYEGSSMLSYAMRRGILDGELEVKDAGEQFVMTLIDGTKVTLDKNEEGLVRAFELLGIDMSESTVAGMSDAMQDSLREIARIFGIPEDVVESVLSGESPALKKDGAGVVENVVDGVEDEMSASKTSLANAFGAVKKEGKKALDEAGTTLYDKGKNVGKEVPEGLKDGLEAKSLFNQIKSSIEGKIDDNVIDAAKKLLEISSPSKVFEEIGKNVWEGFKNGISAGDSSVKGAVNGLLAGVTGSSNGGSIEATVNIKKGWNGTVQDELGLNNLSTDVTVDANTAWKANKVLDYIGLVGLKSIVGVDTKTQWSKNGALSYVGLAGLKSIVSMDTKQPWTRSAQGTLQYLGMHGLSSIISMNTNQPWSRSTQGALQYLGMHGLSSIVSMNTNQPWTRSAQGSLQYLGLTNLSTTAKVTASIPWSSSGGGFFSSIANSALRYFGLNDLSSTVSVDVSAPWLSSRRSPLQWLQMDYMKAYVDVDMWTPWWAAHRSPIQWLQMDNLRTVVTVDARLGNVGSVGGFLRRAKGGVFNNGHWSDIPQYAGGGIVGAARSWYDSVAKYAKGSSGVHGSLFVAGEAGPEIVGHVGGRTEVLNKSQLASTMYSAVANGMLAAISKIDFKMPVMATGSVMPYDIAAQIAKSSADIQSTLDANNEELIQTIIGLAGQIVSALNGVQDATRRNNNAGLSAQQVINEINRRTQMYSESPLRGV